MSELVMTTARTLPDDYTRCHDERCQVREHCMRWTQRNGGGPRAVHAGTLRLAFECHDELCDNAIGTGSGSED